MKIFDTIEVVSRHEGPNPQPMRINLHDFCKEDHVELSKWLARKAKPVVSAAPSEPEPEAEGVAEAPPELPKANRGRPKKGA